MIERVPDFIADLASRQVAVIFAGGSDAVVLAAKAAVSTVPIVFATGGDPVEYGIVASLNRPGGNATGVTIVTAALWPKRLELLRELVPSANLLGVLVNPSHPSSAASTMEVQRAARALGQEIVILNVRSERDFDATFATLLQQKAGGLLVANDPLFTARREYLIALASRHAIPTVYDRPEFVKAGGLMSYGASTVEQYRQAGIYTGRVLKGEKPADLPVLQPTKFELAINLNTARALRLKVPLTLQVAADEVIE
jgi:putative ABC transport system substrate-binding protein